MFRSYSQNYRKPVKKNLPTFPVDKEDTRIELLRSKDVLLLHLGQ